MEGKRKTSPVMRMNRGAQETAKRRRNGEWLAPRLPRSQAAKEFLGWICGAKWQRRSNHRDHGGHREKFRRFPNPVRYSPGGLCDLCGLPLLPWRLGSLAALARV